MQHLQFLENNRDKLIRRFQIIRLVREFFWSQGFLEVETPNILALPGQEPYLSPMRVIVKNEKKQEFIGYLHTSPEYTMKKMIASGFGDIFSICKTYRNEESFGGLHNPEFTMIEWYRVNADMTDIMTDIDKLFFELGSVLQNDLGIVKRNSMRDIWQRFIRVNLDDYLETDRMYDLCVERGYQPNKDERYEDLFYRIFLNEIEPKLIGLNIIYGYPAQLAALAKLSESDERYADRFELYYDSIELANAFGELTNSAEQRKRLEEEREFRASLKRDVYDIDEDFLIAVGRMPKCAGIALGLDRLVQVLSGLSGIDDVLPLGMSDLFG